MNDKIKKSSLQEAKANFDEIQNFAMNEASKNLQEEVSKKVIEIMNKSLEEGEAKETTEDVVNENVTIDANGTTVEISDEGAVTVDPSGMEGEELEMDMDMDMDDEELVVSDEEDEIEIDNSEIEEMEHMEEMNFEEQEAMPAPAVDPALGAEPAPEVAAEMPIEEPAAEMPIEEPAMANPFEEIGSKLDQLINIMGGQGGAGEEVEIVDDAAMAVEPAPVDVPVGEQITFEVVNDMDVPEAIDVLEIVGEMEDDTVEENTMSGQGHAVRRAAGNQGDSHGRTKPEAAEKRKRMNESGDADKDNKAQYEARIAELMKENEGLKNEANEKEEELIKFENGFTKLQENFGEMQDYNAKLVMAYKVAMSGGLTTDEKVQISEQFDNCETVDEAEKLYKSIVKEHNIKVNKNPEKSIKSNTVKSVKSTKSESQPLYESKEVKRWKELAGIKTKEI